MFIPFRSKASGEFFMFDHHARALFELAGKAFAAQGVVSGEQAGVWGQALEAALAAPARTDTPVDETDSSQACVSLKQRAWPLLDMLRKAAAKRVDVVWGSAV